MHTSTRVTKFRTLAPVVVGALLVACGSDKVYEPVCDEQDAGAFTITNPEAGRVYVWGGTGRPGAGEMGRSPGSTSLYWPIDVGFEPSTGKPIVLDHNNHRVLRVDANGKFEKLIGLYFGDPNPVNDPLPKLGPETPLNHPTHVTFAPDGRMVVSAWHNSVVLQMNMATQMVDLVCGTGARCFNGDGQDRLISCLDLPVCAQYHPTTGELYISDQANQLIRRIDEYDVVHVVAGTLPTWNTTFNRWDYYSGYTGDGGPATSAQLNMGRGQVTNPSGRFCFDAAGNMYIADSNNHAIRIIDPNGIIDTFAGMGPGTADYTGDGGPATAARLNSPRDVAADVDGSIFIADTGNHVIRKVAADGTITTVAGAARPSTAVAISACDLQDEQGALANDVHLTLPWGIELDAQGNLWIADTYNQVIRILYR